MAKLKKIKADELLGMVKHVATTGDGRQKLAELYPNAPERLVRAICDAKLGEAEFQSMLADELRSLSAEVTAQIREDLRNGKISPNTKGILLGIIIDKTSQVEGRNAMRTSNVNVQINNFEGRGKTKEQLIAMLSGEIPVKVEPVAAEVPPTAPS